MLPSVWLLGSPQVGKHQLAKCILPDVSSRAEVYNWCIDTKYYTADVTVKSFQVDSTVKTELGLPEALVLVFDATDEGSFKKIQDWTKEHETDAVEIKLLVANKVDLLFNQDKQDVDRPSWLDAVIEWSVTECFEYIETSALRPEIDSKLCLDGENVGTPRVISALQAHMWPGMKQKDDVRRPQQDDGLDVGSVADAAAKDQTCKGKPDQLPASDNIVDLEGIDPEEEVNMDKFDDLLSELHGARERFAGLPDSKRRAAAAELALKLANLLDDDEDEDELH